MTATNSALLTDTAVDNALLSVSDLRIQSGDKHLVGEPERGISFTIRPGERLGLIGESGSGKSLTCLSVMGLLPENLQATGTVELTSGEDQSGPGQPLTDLLGADEQRLAQIRGRRMSMVFQEPMTALNPLMRVGDQVAEIITLHQARPTGGDQLRGTRLREKVIELFAQMSIPEPARAVRAYPHQLSGGQRQRVMLAMAMANEPELLIADEPTTALDVTVQKQVLNLMSEQVRRAGSSLLFITHDLGVVAETCDRVIIMRHGRILETGQIDQVFTAPQHPYTRALLAASALQTRPGTDRLLTLDDAVLNDPVLDQTTPADIVVPSHPEESSSQTEPSGSVPHTFLPEETEDSGHVLFNQSQETQALIQVRGLQRTYGRRGLLGPGRVIPALRGVSFDVPAGQRFGIVGESGCGKSTLLRLLTGLDSASPRSSQVEGTIQIGGRDVLGQRERQLRWLRQSVQIVFQDPMGSLDPRMRIQEIIAEPLTGASRIPDRTERRARVEELLTDVGLPPEAADRYPYQFSGGQRQRIAIARALAPRPQVLVADEAVSALDVSVRAQVLNLLSDLVTQHNLTLVFVSHDLNVVRYACDAVAVMNAGQIVEAGPAEVIFDSPRHPYTARLVEAIPRLTAPVS